VIGGGGDDNLKDRSRGVDHLDCGPGDDTAVARNNDVVEDCETVTRR
jgi:hypothetical protein